MLEVLTGTFVLNILFSSEILTYKIASDLGRNPWF